jgi:hypothetical protein
VSAENGHKTSTVVKAKCSGRVIYVDEFGCQYVQTDSAQPDMRTLKFMGLSAIQGAAVGSYVDLRYEVTYLSGHPVAGVWKGVVVLQ